jgi:D-2-hydroxyacid dehydrogenase (NADP+)
LKFVAWMAYHLETREIVDDYVRRARRALEGHELVVCEDLESIKREIADADAMIGWRITPEVFAEARKLKWIQFGSAGIDHTLFPELLESDVVLTTLGGIHTIVVAEHVMALMLALSRRLDVSMRLQAEHRYERDQIASTAFELSGKTVGIVGLGRIGLNIARLAKAFGMRVVGTKRTFVPSLPNVDEVFPAEALGRILPLSDFLVLVVPLTENTRTLLGREEIARMKDGAYLVNVARGAMVDHDALGEALRSGKLAGAALDVFPQEPLPEDSPIWSFPNVILTPHTGGSHPGYSESASEVFRQNLQAFLSGGEMVNVYRRERGY